MLWAINPGVGRVSLSSIPRYLLLVGNKTSAGSAVADQDLHDIFPNTDADALFGARSELAWMIRMARKVPGVRIKAIACVEASGGTAATLTITITGTASTNGTLRFYLATKTINVVVPSGTTQNATAALVQAAFAADPEIPCTAAVVDNVVTLTIANVGVRGNDWTCYFDPSEKPGTTAVALAGSAAVNPGKNGVVGAKFGATLGAGTDNLTNVLAVLQGSAFFTCVFAQNDTSTNVPLLKTYNDAKAAIGSQIFEHVVLGHTGSYANALTLAKTTINKHRIQVAWQRGAGVHPAMLAASMGAVRTQKEQLHPNRRFNGDLLPGIPAARAQVDWPSVGETGEEDAALNNGLTPVRSNDQGEARVVRSITTLCVRNSVSFYGCIDSGQARTPDTAAELLTLAWDTEYSVNNEYVGPDPEDGEEDPSEGTATPRGWTSYAQGLLEEQIPKHWFSSVSVSTEYDPDQKMLLCTINLQVAPLNHRLAGNINQVV
jgi:phage tail sheath gpL-like